MASNYNITRRNIAACQQQTSCELQPLVPSTETVLSQLYTLLPNITKHPPWPLRRHHHYLVWDVGKEDHPLHHLLRLADCHHGLPPAALDE